MRERKNCVCVRVQNYAVTHKAMVSQLSSFVDRDL